MIGKKLLWEEERAGEQAEAKALLENP